MCFVSALQAQKIDSAKVPQVVRTKLWRIYPKANDITWSYDCFTQSSTVNGITQERKLCFDALFRVNGQVVNMKFDSTATWYQDWNFSASKTPVIAPQQAKDIATALIPKPDSITWMHSDEYDLSQTCEYEAYASDSMKEYHICFDAAWKFLGTVTLTWNYDSTIITVDKINKYIHHKFRLSKFMFAQVTKEADGTIKEVSVEIKVRGVWYNRCWLKFDGNGNLIDRPVKYKAHLGVF